MTLAEARSKIKPHEMARLDWNFEQNNTDFVKIADGLYVGIYMQRLDNMVIIEEEGKWALTRKLLPSDTGQA